MKNWMRKINGVSDVLRGGLREGILPGGRLRGGALLFMAGLVFASAYIFTGCSDDSAGGKSVSEEKNGAQISGGSLASGGNVRGKLLIAGMASDGAVTSGAASRSATSSFNLEGKDSSKYRWVVNAYYKENESGEEFVEGSINTENMTYSVALPKTGEWILKIYLEISTDADDEDFIRALSNYDKDGKDGTTVTVKSIDSVIEQPVVLYPFFNESVSGEINLTIWDYTFDRESFTKLSSVKYSAVDLNESDNKIDEEEEFFGNDTIGEGSDSRSVGYAEIKLDGIKPSTYDFTFVFIDNDGFERYICHEAITVFPGLTTDTWFGEGSHLKKNAETGKIEFIITDELLDLNGLEFVPQTDTVLFNLTTKEVNGVDVPVYKFYKWNENSSNTDPDFESETTDFKSFCFDNEGNVYAITKLWEDNGSDMTTLFSDKYGFGSDGEAEASFYKFTNICYDRTKKYLYGTTDKTGGSGGSETDWYYWLCRFDASSDLDWWQQIHPAGSKEHCLSCVHNGILYDLGKESSYNHEYILSVMKLPENYTDQVYETVQETYLIDLNNYKFDLSDAFHFTDMMYQDGKIYILGKEYFIMYGDGISNKAFNSRGILIEVDLFDGNIRRLGFIDDRNSGSETDEVTPYTKFTFNSENATGGNFNLFTPGDISGDTKTYPYIVYGGEDSDNNSILTKEATKIFGYINSSSGPINRVFCIPNMDSIDPSKAEEAVFLGPEKFVALKPKKLVIADNGIAFYTDSEGVWGYKNVNRIVTVDLEEFAIESSKDAGVKFNSDKKDKFIIRGSSFDVSVDSLLLRDTPQGSIFLFARTEASTTLVQYNGDKVFVGFECKDE